MVSVGDDAPEFGAPLANGDVGEFTLSTALGNGPVVLAFSPRAFTSTPTAGLRTLRDRIENPTTEGTATLYGISTDSPFALDEFRDREALPVAVVSDTNGAVIDLYDGAFDFEAGLARRGVRRRRGRRRRSTRGRATTRGVEPDYGEVWAAAAAVDWGTTRIE